ncbi:MULTISPECIES: TonB-dependent receptor [Aliiglaciecola]|uniref:TonB-dependent receptor n=1 Tax=Aliiglaciecola TaxID=1406885 RepID=UPI001C098958|nr:MULTISPECIES: TonB-dependent receptor [Aliiglaciecola]MBU2878995.1 TonB-dependent receptor [Aliiglaciecola lipolytica]MDO6710693.1 TonB-dependent receptor [Aliiglaciecola sp. 2_MG-2023]MDO6751899.1 TonB-dependent receptor [Aliiglaciecola sp. 1_MG-2023]
MKKNKNFKLTLLAQALLTIASAGTVTTAVSAQEVDMADNANVERVVVTAKNRVEPLQEVPLAINVLSGDDLKNNQINGMRDLQDAVPNLYLSGANRNDPTAVGMRGLTPNTSDERYQGVSFFLDGIPLSGQLASLGLNGVERVEVIKGPQAASFGRATYSGAVNFVTKELGGDEVTGNVRAKLGQVKGGPDTSYLLEGSVEIPLIDDKLWLGISGSTFQNGGVTEAVDDGSSIGQEKSNIASLELYYTPSDTLSVKLRGLYSHDRDGGNVSVIQHPRDWVEAGADFVTLPRASGSRYPTVLPDPDFDKIANLGASGTTRDRYFTSLIVKKEIGDYELTYSGGYFYNEDERVSVYANRDYAPGQDPVFGDLVGTDEIDLSFYAGFTFPSREIFENFSQQLVLLSPGDSDFRWRAGLYYFYESDETQFTALTNSANPNGTARRDKMENYAIFGGFDYDLTEQLTFSAEGRIADEKVIYTDCPNCTSPIAEGDSYSSTDFSPRLTLSYKLSDDNMLYGLYSSGVKSARLSRIVVNGEAQVASADPEELDNFELGSKNEFYDGLWTLNMAAFYQHVENQQLVSSVNVITGDGAIPVTYVNNVGESEVSGFEIESKVAISDSFSLNGSVGYAKHEFVNDEPFVMSATSAWGFPGEVGDPVSLDGKTQTNVPKWNGRLGGEYYVADAYKNMSLSVRFDANYRGKFYADLSNLVTIESAWTFNGRISLTGDDLEVALYGKNIFNQDRAIGAGLAGSSSVCAFVETDTATYGNNQLCLQATGQRPAEFGVEVGYRF